MYYPQYISIPPSLPFAVRCHLRVLPIDNILINLLCSLAPGNTYTIQCRPDTSIPFGIRCCQSIFIPINHLIDELDSLHISVFFHADAIDIVLHTKTGIDIRTQPYSNPRRWSINYGNHVHTPSVATRR